MEESNKYGKAFFSEMEINSDRAAKAMLPLVNDLFHPKSVIDIGCGTGVWLRTWKDQFGVTDYKGIDGPYVDVNLLKIPAENFLAADLKKPIGIKRQYDLVMSLEVAEHLPESVSKIFVESLVSLGDVILFSAAIPGQTGTYHINEQFPEFWARLFNEAGLVAVDFIRPKIWNDPAIEFYYKQNTLLFIKEDVLTKYPHLKIVSEATDPNYLTRIHPFLYNLKLTQLHNTRTFFGYINWRWYMFKRKYIFKDPSLNA